MTTVRFRNFVPKDDDLRSLVVPPVSVDTAGIESEFLAQVTLAKESLKSVSKKPSNPNWDLKRDFANSQRKLDIKTSRAIAELCGKDVMDEEVVEEEKEEVKEENDLVQLSSDDDEQVWRDDLDIHDE